MRYFTTKDIATTIGVNIESVRRWIRNGVLKADYIKKEGFSSGQGKYLISEEDLNVFLEEKCKYGKILSSIDRLNKKGINKETLNAIDDINRGLLAAENSIKTAIGYIEITNGLIRDLMKELNGI